jgi:hypothetical protein
MLLVPEPRRVYLDANAELYCLVDEIDYLWAIQWTWSFTPNSTGLKLYATRMTRRRRETTKQIKIYMHKAILERADFLPPTTAHTMGDHKDMDSLNNVRDNLRWATPSMNAINRRLAA